MAKKPIFLLNLQGKTLEEAEAEVHKAFAKFEKAKNAPEPEEEAEVYFVKTPKPNK